MKLLTKAAILLVFLTALPAHAHVNSKDVFEQLTAGPYKLFVTVRPPTIIPGVATVEVRSYGAPIGTLTDTPMLLTGEASHHPPTPDAMKRSPADPSFFTGQLWIMESGSWQVRFGITGPPGSQTGTQTAAVPVPAVSTQVLRMQRPMGLLLAVLGLILVLGVGGIVFGAVREARLRPGIAPDANRGRRAFISAFVALALVAFAVYWGNRWWNVEAADYAADLYQPYDLHPALSGNQLQLLIGSYDASDKQWEVNHKLKLLPDHGHLMHLYAIRWPQMDVAYHLHPALTAPGQLTDTLPAMPSGTYHLYADIVHTSGFPETLTATLTVPANMPATPLDAEDASATPAPLSAGMLGSRYTLPDGYTMVWDRTTPGTATLSANTAALFRFTLLDPAGKPATGMQPYLGMAGHAAFVKTDGSVFAHTHPDGSAAMPAMMLAQGSANEASGREAMSDMAATNPDPLSPTVEFPYGFPTTGRYRIFIQMKHNNTVETGVFDAQVN